MCDWPICSVEIRPLRASVASIRNQQAQMVVCVQTISTANGIRLGLYAPFGARKYLSRRA